MTCYLCDVCGSVFPSRQPGAQSVIAGQDGYTSHVCSSACHRALVNRDARASRRLKTRARMRQSFRDFPEIWVAAIAAVTLLSLHIR